MYNYCYELNITGALEIELLGDLFSNRRHLLQQLRVLLVRAVGS
jgi:hypothetical protein